MFYISNNFDTKTRIAYRRQFILKKKNNNKFKQICSTIVTEIRALIRNRTNLKMIQTKYKKVYLNVSSLVFLVPFFLFCKFSIMICENLMP